MTDTYNNILINTIEKIIKKGYSNIISCVSPPIGADKYQTYSQMFYLDSKDKDEEKLNVLAESVKLTMDSIHYKNTDPIYVSGKIASYETNEICQIDFTVLKQMKL